MCDESSEYNSLIPPVIIGGPTGDYKILPPISSNQWVEYRVLTVAYSGAGSVVVSGDSKPIAMDYSGGTTLNNDAFAYGEAYSAGGSGTQVGQNSWKRITNSERRLFIRIDTNSALFVTLQFRPRLIKRVPGPSHEVHPDYEENLNKARSEQIKVRLKNMGIPGYAVEEEEPLTKAGRD